MMESNGRATKTKIMYKAYLSYAQLKECLSLLTENELIGYNAGESEYKTTEKGAKFLRVYDQMSGLTGEMKVPQNS
jgi:predicted transcriptional regulator